MSLSNRFKTDVSAATDGVWFDYPEAANEDGTVPGFKLARKSKHNRKYLKELRAVTKRYTNSQGVVDFSKAGDDEADKEFRRIFVSTILLDWRNIEEDNKKLSFSEDAARTLINDEAWNDLYLDLDAKAENASNFRQGIREEEAKNS